MTVHRPDQNKWPTTAWFFEAEFGITVTAPVGQMYAERYILLLLAGLLRARKLSMQVEMSLASPSLRQVRTTFELTSHKLDNQLDIHIVR